MEEICHLLSDIFHLSFGLMEIIGNEANDK